MEIKIVNILQVAKYMKNGVQPIDYFVDLKTNKLVFVFNKDDTAEVWQRWLNRTLD